MFAHRLDARLGLIVWYFGGTTNSDADYQGYVETFARADALGETVAAPAGILYVERDNPMPSAKWRKRMADASSALKSKPIIAFASASPMVRGIVTAINWLRPPPYTFEVFSTFEEAVAWVTARRGDVPTASLRRMLDECRDEVARSR